jgi:hypothetical protein
MRGWPAVSIAFFGGIALLAAGQVVPSFAISAFFQLLGGALLVVVAIRALASWAGLHQSWTPALEAGETLLVESENVSVETRPLLFGGRRGPYRARLTNRRVLLSLRVFTVMTRYDVTVAWLDPGRPLSLVSIEVLPTGQIILRSGRRFAGAWRLWVPNVAAWREALEASHPELIRGREAWTSGYPSTST